MFKYEKVKNLPLEKKHAMLTCLGLIVNADNDVTEKENKEVVFQVMHILDLSPSEIKKGMLKPSELGRILDSMTGDELAMLGMLMGRVAGSDGHLDSREVNSIRTILKIAKLNPKLIEAIVDTIEVE